MPVTYIPAQDWFAVYATDLPSGEVALTAIRVAAFRIEDDGPIRPRMLGDAPPPGPGSVFVCCVHKDDLSSDVFIDRPDARQLARRVLYENAPEVAEVGEAFAAGEGE